MKKLILTSVLLLTTIWLFGQEGLFGLSYGTTYAKAKQLLEENEVLFSETSKNGNICEFVPEDQTYVDYAVLIFHPEKDELVFWKIYYFNDYDIEEVVLDAAESWHEDYEYYDDDLGCWIWDFSEDHKLFVGYNWDYQFVAEYYNEEFSQYSEFVY